VKQVGVAKAAVAASDKEDARLYPHPQIMSFPKNWASSSPTASCLAADDDGTSTATALIAAWAEGLPNCDRLLQPQQ
jgi:hypothetical protein